MARRDDDPGLPIKLHPCSNGEFVPPPATPVVREAVRRARDQADENARRLGWSRRRFLRSSMGAATTLAALAACSNEAAQSSSPGSTAGGTYAIDGHQERIGESIFLFTPNCVQVSTPTEYEEEIFMGQPQGMPMPGQMPPAPTWGAEPMARMA